MQFSVKVPEQNPYRRASLCVSKVIKKNPLWPVITFAQNFYYDWDAFWSHTSVILGNTANFVCFSRRQKHLENKTDLFLYWHKLQNTCLSCIVNKWCFGEILRERLFSVDVRLGPRSAQTVETRQTIVIISTLLSLICQMIKICMFLNISLFFNEIYNWKDKNEQEKETHSQRQTCYITNT